ncbi:hypothetical protein [uncultured Robinsoniella sp.]
MLLAVESLELGRLVELMVSLIPVGFLLGFFCLLVGLGISGVMKIFKRA